MIDVVVAIIRDPQQRILISQRTAQQSYAGYWEFPGGKLESDESQYNALVRELAEEIGIEVLEAAFLKTFEHAYDSLDVILHIWQVEKFTGEPFGKEGQVVRWVTIEELDDFEFPEANAKIIALL